MELGQDTPAIISGGASGLGAALAQTLAKLGVPVGIIDLKDGPGPHLFAKADITDHNAVRDALGTLRAAQGQERICVNCAGIATGAKTVSRGEAHDPEVFARTININLIGTFHVASLSAAGMAASDPLNPDNERGVIINTASIAAFDGAIGQIAYAASKAGVAGMTLPMARDLTGAGIRVMTIAPGIFKTPMVTSMTQDLQDALASNIPFPSRLGDPAEFARLVVHIAQNAMLNGETIRLDGTTRLTAK